MKLKIKNKELEYIEIDAEINNLETNFKWNIIIDIYTGQIINWGIGKKSIKYEVRDNGNYHFIGKDNIKLFSLIDEFVPFIIPNVYNDFIEMNINENGIIENWNPPTQKDIDFIVQDYKYNK